MQVICKESFSKDGFFFLEHDKIFVSSLAANKHYKNIIEMLAKKSYLTREEILKSLKITSTGSISAVLQDLEDCGFIASYSPLENASATRLTRYCLKDAYLQFYYRFVHSQRARILRSKDDNVTLSKWIQKESLDQSLGFSFERWCRFNAEILAKAMKFDQVNYSSGAFYSRKLQSRGMEIVRELHHREFAKYSVEYALIVAEEITDLSKYQDLFDHVVDLNGIMQS